MAALHRAPGYAPPSSSLQGMRGGGRQGWKGRMGETSMRGGLEEDDHVRSTHLPSPPRPHCPPSSTICFRRLDPPVSPSSTYDTALPRGPRQPSQCRRHIHGPDQHRWLPWSHPSTTHGRRQPFAAGTPAPCMRFSYCIRAGSSSTKSREANENCKSPPLRPISSRRRHDPAVLGRSSLIPVAKEPEGAPETRRYQ